MKKKNYKIIAFKYKPFRLCSPPPPPEIKNRENPRTNQKPKASLFTERAHFSFSKKQKKQPTMSRAYFKPFDIREMTSLIFFGSYFLGHFRFFSS